MPVNFMKHQTAAIDFALANNGVAAFYHDIGCGKTLSAIGTFVKLREKNQHLKLFVFCPLSLIEAAWGAEITKYTTFKYRNLNRNPLKESDLIGLDDCHIYIANFEYIISDDKFETLSRFLRRYRWMCAIDESSKMKNNKAETTKKIIKLKNFFENRIIMSGTPAPNSEMEYWGQMTFLNDRIFHPNFYAFRNTYFCMRRGNDFIPGAVLSRLQVQELYKKGYKYYLKPDEQKKLVSRMMPFTHLVKKSECMDLPEQIDQYRRFELEKIQRRIYEDMEEEAIAEMINKDGETSFVISKIALTKLMKLRQIISGFAIDENGSVNPMKPNPKLAELEDLLDEIGNQQAIIWCNFKQEIADVTSLIGDRACFMWGEVPLDEREQAVIDFKSGAKQFLVANPASAGHGLTFVNCNLEIFYSMDFSYEKYEQARGRIHRYGQKNNCLYIHLMGENTIDSYIMDVLQRKKTMDESIKSFILSRQG